MHLGCPLALVAQIKRYEVAASMIVTRNCTHRPRVAVHLVIESGFQGIAAIQNRHLRTTAAARFQIPVQVIVARDVVDLLARFKTCERLAPYRAGARISWTVVEVLDGIEICYRSRTAPMQRPP